MTTQGSSSSAGLLSEAERIKHQAERKPDGAIKESLLGQCAELLEQALVSNLSLGEEEDALFDLGEVYASLGISAQVKMYENLGSVCSGSLLRLNALKIQLEALERSANFYRKSHEMYEKIISKDSAQLKQEATINSGNSLCDWADICIELPVDRGGGAEAAANLYVQADLRYSFALSGTPDDVELGTNFGDCNIKRAELAILVGGGTSPKLETWMTAKMFYTKAMAAYGHACSLADASRGDDLAGLLQNWGAGLLSLAERAPDTTETTVAFEQALDKLRAAAKFRPTDVSIFVAIGEACCTQAEKLDRLQALDLLLCALEEGFGTALKINATCLDVIIGKGEGHLAVGKLAICIERQSLAEEHLLQSFHSYKRALQILEADVRNECRLKFDEQCNVLYNLACVAALCNQETVCTNALTLLVRVDGISNSEIAEDSDLQSLKSKEWFQALLQTGG